MTSDDLKRYARNGIVSGIMIVLLCMCYITKPKTGEDESFRCCCCHQVWFSHPLSVHRYNTQRSMLAQPRIITYKQYYY